MYLLPLSNIKAQSLSLKDPLARSLWSLEHTEFTEYVVHRPLVPQMRGFARGAEYAKMYSFAFVPTRDKGKALSS